MGTRRLGFALVAALIISIVITSFFYIRVTRQSGKGAQTKRVVAANGSLQPGMILTADNITEINWPVNVSLEGLIEKKEDAIGRVLIYGVESKEPVLKHDLAPAGSFGLAAKIPDGMRATSVKTNEVMNIAGFIFPGSRVDVLVTLRGDGGNMTTHTVLQNVQVLATGTKTDPDPNGKPENVSVVTLLVTPEESEKLALAQSQASQNQGNIHFVLRNGGDIATPNTAPVDMAELAGIEKKAPPPPVKGHTRRVAAPAAAPAEYTVETLVGGKVIVNKFPVTAQ
ncbi:MAG TPA: Flp pilus assembly protein CpaB [Candidatus Angelobacter sp.]